MCNSRFSVLLVTPDHHAWHLKAQREVHRHQQKPSLAHTTVVADDELCHFFFFFGHVCRDGRTKSVWAKKLSLDGVKRKIQRTLNSDM